MCSQILVFDEYLMLLLPLGVVADGDVRFKNLTYGCPLYQSERPSENLMIQGFQTTFYLSIQISSDGSISVSPIPAFFRYCPGEIPYCFLNALPKWVSDWKPTFSATDRMESAV